MQAQQPLDLNRATSAELQRLGCLTSQEIKHFLAYRKQYGPFISVYELQAITGWNLHTIRAIYPFISISLTERPNTPLDKFQKWKQSVTARINEGLLIGTKKYKAQDHILWMVKRGKTPYIGVKAKRSCLQYRNFRWKKLLQNLSLYIVHPLPKELGTLIFGHYKIGLGQGLLVSKGMIFNQPFDKVNILRIDQDGISPIFKTSTSNALQGITYTLPFLQKACKLIAYASYDTFQIKGYLDDDNKPFVRSVNPSYTSTKNREGQIDLTSYSAGGAFLWQDPAEEQYEVGIQLFAHQYSLPVIPCPDFQEKGSFAGQKQIFWSLFGRYAWLNMNFFSEVVYKDPQTVALIAGCMSCLNKQTDLACLFKYYPAYYFAPQGKAWGINSHNQNEKGFYLALKHKKEPFWNYTAFLDYAYRMRKDFKHHSPSRSLIGYFESAYQKNRQYIIKASLKGKYNTNVLQNSNWQTELATLKSKHTLNISYSYPLSIENCEGKSNLQLLHVTPLNEGIRWGIGLGQNLYVKHGKESKKGQLIFFCGSAHTKPHMQELDMIKPMSRIFLQGIGVRMALTMKKVWNRKTQLWLTGKLKIYKPYKANCNPFKVKVPWHIESLLSLKAVYQLTHDFEETDKEEHACIRD